MEIDFKTKILIISAGVSIFLLAIGIFSLDTGVIGNAVILSTFIVAVPQFLIRYERFKTLREMEEKFPLFLRDMIESIRSGMPFHQAVVISSDVDYGKLSREIKKMSNQISWGIPFDRVIDQFADRSKDSRRLSLALRTIKESYASGGDVVSALESVADTAIVLDEADKEKRSLLNQYVILMYGISLLFLGVVAGINKLMVPIFQVTSTTGPGMGGSEQMGIINPCENPYGFGGAICGGFQTVCGVFNIDPLGISCYYTSLFFFMSIVQSICSGLVAGQISENSILAGVKHSIIMTAITFGAFNILIRLGILGV